MWEKKKVAFSSKQFMNHLETLQSSLDMLTRMGGGRVPVCYTLFFF